MADARVDEQRVTLAGVPALAAFTGEPAGHLAWHQSWRGSITPCSDLQREPSTPGDVAGRVMQVERPSS